MSGKAFVRARQFVRWGGIAIGVVLLAIEWLDARLTPQPDWLWFGAGVLLIAVCWNMKAIADGRR